jgi:hypothetical protein
VRLTRLPACWRGQKEQKLLYFAPSAPDLTLEDIMPRRDVLRNWRAEAVRVSAVADRDGQYPQPDTAKAAQACRFYGKFDAWLHDAAGELERQLKGNEQTDRHD